MYSSMGGFGESAHMYCIFSAIKTFHTIFYYDYYVEKCNMHAFYLSTTVKSVLCSHSKIDKTKVLTTGGSLMQFGTEVSNQINILC